MRKSFLLHLDSLCILDEMTNEQAGEFIKAIYHYQITGELPKLDFAIKMAITPFVNQFVRDSEKYDTVVEKRKLAGSMGGKQRVANDSKSKQVLASANTSKQNQANQAVSKNDSDNVNDSDNESKKDSKKVSFKKETNFDQLFENVEISENRKLLLTDWLLYKRERKESYRPRGFKMLVKILSEYSDEIVQKAIEASISSNWSGLFPEKVIINKVKPQGYTPLPKPVEIRNEANNYGLTEFNRIMWGDKDYNERLEYLREQSKLQTQ